MCYPPSVKRTSFQPTSQGPFRADQLRPGDPYELSRGHPIQCLPTGGRGAKASGAGASVLASDPAVESLGLDAGYAPSADTLRAPDLSVGEIPDQPGWVAGAPALAVEYADTGQDEKDLAVKIQELLAAGTRYVWVVRMTGLRRVEVHEAGRKMHIAHAGEELRAPGVLANPVPVEALYDRKAAQEVVLRNLLQRRGYASLEAVQAEGEAQGLREAIVAVLTARGLAVGDDLQTALARIEDPAALRPLVPQAATVASAKEILAALRG